MAVNDPFYADGSVELLQSTGIEPTIFYVGGGLYVVHEYVAAGGGSTVVPIILSMNHFNGGEMI